MTLCSFPVLWNNVAVFQFNVSLPHCNGKFVVCFLPFFRPTGPSVPFFAVTVLLFPHIKLVYFAFIFVIFHILSILVYQHFVH